MGALLVKSVFFKKEIATINLIYVEKELEKLKKKKGNGKARPVPHPVYLKKVSLEY